MELGQTVVCCILDHKTSQAIVLGKMVGQFSLLECMSYLLSLSSDHSTSKDGRVVLMIDQKESHEKIECLFLCGGPTVTIFILLWFCIIFQIFYY